VSTDPRVARALSLAQSANTQPSTSGAPRERDEGVGGDLRQPRFAHHPWKSAPEPEVGATLGEERMEARSHLVRQVLFGPDDVDGRQWLHRRVEVLDEEPAAGPQRGDHALERVISIGEVDENEPGVDEIEVSVRRVVGRDIVLTDVDVAAGGLLGRCDVDVVAST
jgi:hypothetical protein